MAGFGGMIHIDVIRLLCQHDQNGLRSQERLYGSQPSRLYQKQRTMVRII